MTIVRPSVDAWVDQNRPSANFGQTTQLRVRGTTNFVNRTFIFVGRPFPLGAQILEAKLRFSLASAWTGQTLTVQRVTQSWGESRLTWNNQPNTTSTNQGTAAITGSTGDRKEVDITALMGDVSAGAASYGLRLNLAAAAAERRIWSSEATWEPFRPEIEVVWSEIPDAPVNLVPGGGLAVHSDKPVLSWQFAERGYSADQQEQSASQVQISTSTSFASPEYDSGKESNIDSQWDLSATAYGGVPADATRYWRVKVWDEADNESAYSDTQEFNRTTKGTLSLSSPGATVGETTPPVAWSLTGRTQASHAAFLYIQVSGVWKLIYTWPRTTGTTTSVTVPPYMIFSGFNYKVVVRVWDTIDRIGTGGDPTYSEVSQEFTYSTAGFGTATTGLTAVPDGAKVVLTWQRTSMPDYFALVVDGVEVEPRIDPTDVFDAGTTYTYDYWGAIPGKQHTYEVEAVTDDGGILKHSTGNATANATSDPKGIYLVDPTDSTFIRIVGESNVDLAIRETGTTFDIIGSRTPVRITDAVMGYAGSISGRVRSSTDRDTFLDLKGRLVPLRLILLGLNIPVVLEEAATQPEHGMGDAFAVSFSCFQSGDFTFDIAGG